MGELQKNHIFRVSTIQNTFNALYFDKINAFKFAYFVEW